MLFRGFLAAAVTCCLAAPVAFAQQPQLAAPGAAARCTGVLCDLYYSGKPVPAAGQPDIPDPTHLPCHDFLCAAFGGRTPDPAPVAAEPVAAPTPEPTKSAKRARKVRKSVASVEATKSEAAK